MCPNSNVPVFSRFGITKMGFMMVAIEVAKKHASIGTLLRCACAFGAKEIIVVGWSVYSTYGAHGAQKHLPIRHFYTWMEALHYIKIERGCDVVGIASSVSATSTAIFDVEYKSGNVCFVVENKLGSHLPSVCDRLCHVPIPNLGEESIVHMDSKDSACLQHFCTHSTFQTIPYRDGKHQVNGNVAIQTRGQNDRKPHHNLLNLELEAFDSFHLFTFHEQY